MRPVAEGIEGKCKWRMDPGYLSISIQDWINNLVVIM
jgi:hypothetical protein